MAVVFVLLRVDDDLDPVALAPVVAATLPPVVAAAEPEFDAELPDDCAASFEFEGEFDAVFDAEFGVEEGLLVAAVRQSVQAHFIEMDIHTRDNLTSQD